MSEMDKQLIRALGQARLADQERARLRERLYQVVELDRIRGERVAPTPSPYFTFAWMRLVPALLVVLVIFGGVSASAEGALPGDILYPIKRYVNEGVQSLLAGSTEGQALWQAKRVARRLGEAESLLAAGRLNPAVRAELELDVADSAEKFSQKVAELEAGEQIKAAAEVSVKFENSLTKGAPVLNKIAAAEPGAAPTQPLSPVHKALPMASAPSNVDVVPDTKELRENMIMEADTGLTLTAKNQVTLVEAKLQDLRRLGTKHQTALAIDTTRAEEFAKRLGEVETLFNQASASLVTGDLASALPALQKAQRLAQETRLWLLDLGLSISAKTKLNLGTAGVGSL